MHSPREEEGVLQRESGDVPFVLVHHCLVMCFQNEVHLGIVLERQAVTGWHFKACQSPPSVFHLISVADLASPEATPTFSHAWAA